LVNRSTATWSESTPTHDRLPRPRAGASISNLDLEPDLASIAASGLSARVGPVSALATDVRLPLLVHCDSGGSASQPGYAGAYLLLGLASRSVADRPAHAGNAGRENCCLKPSQDAWVRRESPDEGGAEKGQRENGQPQWRVSEPAAHIKKAYPVDASGCTWPRLTLLLSMQRRSGPRAATPDAESTDFDSGCAPQTIRAGLRV
jgi:hypothetical protein